MTDTLVTSQDRPAITLRQRTQSTRVRAYAALALGVLCIGFSAIFTKWANMAGTVHITGAVSAFYRMIIATIALTIPYGLHLVRVQRRGHKARVYAVANGTAIEPAKSKLSGLRSKVLWGTVIAGLFFALDLGFWNTSLLFTSAANATLLGNLSTLWVSLGALFIFHESLKRRFWWGMAIALVGVAIVVGRDVLEHPRLGWGDLLAIGSSTLLRHIYTGDKQGAPQTGHAAFYVDQLGRGFGAAICVCVGGRRATVGVQRGAVVVAGSAGAYLARAGVDVDQLRARAFARAAYVGYAVVAACYYGVVCRADVGRSARY